MVLVVILLVSLSVSLMAFVHLCKALFKFIAGDVALVMVARPLEEPLKDFVLLVAAIVLTLLSLLVVSESGVADEVALGVVIVYLEFSLEFLVGDINSADLNHVLVSTGHDNSGDILQHSLVMLLPSLMEGDQHEVVQCDSIIFSVLLFLLKFSCVCLHLLIEVRGQFSSVIVLICLQSAILMVLSNMSCTTISSFIPIVLLVISIYIVMVFVI